MASAAGIVLVTAFACATGMAALAAIAAAIEVLPSRPGSGSEPIDARQYRARGAGAGVTHAS